MSTKTHTKYLFPVLNNTSSPDNFTKKATKQSEVKKENSEKLLLDWKSSWMYSVKNTVSHSEESFKTATRSSALISFLSNQGFKIKNGGKVKEFFEQNPSLDNYFYDLPNKIIKYFDDPEKKIIEISEAREEGKPEKTLIVDLYTELPPNKAVEKLDKLDQNWLIPLYNSTKIYNINTLISYL